MNKSSLKTFAIWGRNELRENVRIKLEILGIDEKKITKGDTHNNLVSINGFEYNKGQYDSLVKKYNDLGYTELVEEVAYTWFNRLTALAYMEINEYSDDRLIYSTTSKIDPDIMDNYVEANFFEKLPQDRKNMIHDLKDTHKLEEMYSILVEEKCHELSKTMPFMFEKSSDYTELLFPSGLLLEDSFLVKLREEIKESVEEIDGEKRVPVELIGWLYQFYNSEKKDEVFEGLKKNKKITKENIPAATQLFTPKWIVKYMAENSLGKLAVENLGVSEGLKKGWKYYITPPSDGFPCITPPSDGSSLNKEEPGRDKWDKDKKKHDKIKIEDIKILDPAMGSGHMLTYSFDLLYDIYEDLGWSSKEAVLSILKNNIYGLEIDDRAGMLASFAVMMKAREKFRRLFKVLERLDEDEKIILNTLAIQESNSISQKTIDLIQNTSLYDLEELIEVFKDAKEYGSILKLECESEELYMDEIKILKTVYKQQGQMGLFGGVWNFEEDLELLEKLAHQGDIMSDKYDVTITNPPYMGGKGYTPTLKKYVEKEYKDSKSDLFAVFIERCGEYTKKDRYTAMITMHSWMFLSSFEKLRTKLIETKKIDTMLHLGTRAFEEIGGEVVQTTAWVTKNNLVTNDTNPHESKGKFVRLVDYKNSQWKQDEFKNNGNYFHASQKDFSKIPGSPIAYWVSDRVKEIFENNNLINDQIISAGRTKTHGDDSYLRMLWEINLNNKKWKVCQKGGETRKWYGNADYLINWNEEAQSFYKSHGGLRNKKFDNFKGITWGMITSGNITYRIKENNHEYLSMSPTIAFPEEKFEYLLGFLNSKLSYFFYSLLNVTLGNSVGNILKIPFLGNQSTEKIESLVKNCLRISNIEWDSRETSWDFKTSPLTPPSDGFSNNRETKLDNLAIVSSDMRGNDNKKGVELACENYEKIWIEKFVQMHKNEEELNRLFIDIYELQDEMDKYIDFKDITLLKKEKNIMEIEIPSQTQEQIDENDKTPEGYLYNRGAQLVFNRFELVKQFISYAVGCIMGRYSIDKPGLIIANSDDELITPSVLSDTFPLDKGKEIHIVGADGETRHTIESPRFIPDAFGVIPVTGEKIFDNDIVTRIEEFIKALYGSETLNENLEFIGTHLGIKTGESPRECIRRYFIKDFYTDHLQRYKKRPIYWMVNSGKKEGFSALIYMHRYRDNTIGRVRTDYLNRYQETMENILDSNHRRLGDEDLKAKDTKIIEREIKTINSQIDELKKFAMDIKDIADKKIVIDLDDGVKVNYAKFGKILKKI